MGNRIALVKSYNLHHILGSHIQRVSRGVKSDFISFFRFYQDFYLFANTQAVLLNKVLADMKNKELNAQLKVVLDEKQDILERIAAQEQDEEQRAAQASRQREMEEWLDQQPLCFTEYDDTLTRRFVEQVTVVDAETIRVKIRDAGIEIERKLC